MAYGGGQAIALICWPASTVSRSSSLGCAGSNATVSEPLTATHNVSLSQLTPPIRARAAVRRCLPPLVPGLNSTTRPAKSPATQVLDVGQAMLVSASAPRWSSTFAPDHCQAALAGEARTAESRSVSVAIRSTRARYATNRRNTGTRSCVERTRIARIALIASVSLLLVGPAAAQIPGNPLNDLFALGKGSGQTPTPAVVQNPAAPPVTAVPRAVCDADSKPEPGIQGRVPAGSAANGLWCNASLISHQGTSGGFKVLRYVDAAGHECAYYDTALLFPLNAVNLNSKGIGVVVLDMADPAHPQQTDLLTEFPMLSPHESLNLNTARGLIAAVSGNPATEPGFVSLV